MITIDLEKAKEIKKNYLRLERVPFLSEQDMLFQRALETGADTSAIVAEKQRLRDITKLPDTCTTVDELLAIKVK